jgi:hypothetical protein
MFWFQGLSNILIHIKTSRFENLGEKQWMKYCRETAFATIQLVYSSGKKIVKKHPDSSADIVFNLFSIIADRANLNHVHRTR